LRRRPALRVQAQAHSRGEEPADFAPGTGRLLWPHAVGISRL